MKKYNEVYSKIKVGDELKKRIIDNASNRAAVSAKEPAIKPKRKIYFNWKRVTAAAMAIVMIFSFTFVAVMQMLPRDTGNPENVLMPDKLSRDDIIERLKYSNQSLPQGDKDDSFTESVPSPAPEGPTGADGNTGSSGNDHTTTNIQQDGVDEGDIIKVDNKYIYMLSRSGLIIVETGEKMKICYRENYENFYPDEMFILGGKLVVIGGEYSQIIYESQEFGVELVPYWSYRTNTKIIVYDLNDRVDVHLLKEYSVSGNFVTSRLIDNRLIVAVNHYVYRDNEETYFPEINGTEVSVDNIFWYNINGYYNSYSYSVLVSLNLSTLEYDIAAHLGLNGMTYFSRDNIYFFNNVYSSSNDDDWTSCSYNYYTVIVKISLESLCYTASQKIDGLVNDRYWADEYEGNLRVVSAFYSYEYKKGWADVKRFSIVYVLNKNLKIIGSIRDIAPNENIHSVRFRGTEGSIVTFLQVDPLFKLDLSDPKNPKISKGLKEEGVSDYLQYLSDDILLGLGRNTSTANGWIQFMGMKISLYDNTGADAVNINTINIGSGYAYSDALNEPKAILNDTAKNMFSFAVTMRGSTGLSVEGQGLLVFEYDLTASKNSDKLVFKGLLTNIQGYKTYANWDDYYYDYFSYVKRGARIGNKIYTISDRYIASYDINTLQLSERLDIYDDICHLTHRWTSWTGSDATCTTAGSKTRLCLNDSSHSETYTIPAHGHSWNNWQVTAAPSALTPGTETRTCYYNTAHKETRELVAAAGVDGLVLTLNETGTEYRVRTYMGTNDRVEIPAEHNNVPICAIDDSAFAYNQVIKNVTIPKSIINIGANAFKYCTNLQNVTFEQDSRLETIGSFAFSECILLKSVTLPKSLTSLSDCLFYRASALESVLFEDGSQVSFIGWGAFYLCINLKNIVIPQTVTTIGYIAFSGCANLESIIIPDNVTDVYSGAFSSCEKLKSVYVPASVTYIASDAFSYNRSLETLTVASGNSFYKSEGNCIIRTDTNTLIAGSNNSIIPDYIERIDSYAFSGSGIKNITIPKNIESIGYSAFSDCTNLKSVVFENGSRLRSISQYAFYNCTSIKSIAIPKSVTNMGYYAFSGWTSAQTINVYGAATKYVAEVKFGINWRAYCNATVRYHA